MSDAVQSTSILQLRPELLAVWDADAFWAYFDALRGAPYGYHNYLFSFFDAGAPLRSLPAPLSTRTVEAFLVTADALLGPADIGLFQPSYNVSLFDALGPALLHRLPAAASCGTLSCITDEALGARTSLLALMAVPEDPTWTYNGTAARVCSAFCAGGLAAGLGAALPPLWPPEQTPRDNWSADLWDAAGWNASSCPTGLARSDSGVPYCQFAGALYKMPLLGAGTLAPYARMNEACGSRWPEYDRCADNSTTCKC